MRVKYDIVTGNYNYVVCRDPEMCGFLEFALNKKDLNYNVVIQDNKGEGQIEFKFFIEFKSGCSILQEGFLISELINSVKNPKVQDTETQEQLVKLMEFWYDLFQRSITCQVTN